MLDANDIELLQGMIKSTVTEVVTEIVDERLTQTELTLNNRIDQVESSLGGRIDQVESRMDHMEHLFFSELGKTQDYFDKKFDALQADMNELKQYQNIRKLENSNVQLFLNRMDLLENRVTKLELQTV